MALVKSSTVAKKRFYKQSFEIKRDNATVSFHTLLVNPEDLNMDEPVRASVTQTLGGAFVTDFGQGLPTVTISGTTGYKARSNAEGKIVDGFEEFVNFRRDIYRQFISTNDPKLSMFWYNWEDDEYYEIQPMSFRLMRNKSQPLLYRYEFKFTCLRVVGNKRLANVNVPDPSVKNAEKGVSLASSSLSEFLNTAR